MLPADIIAELQPLAERLGLEMPRAIEALVSIAARFQFQGRPPPLAAEPEPLQANDCRAAA